MHLRVVTPSELVIDSEVSSAEQITAPGVSGEFGILPGHVTFLGGVDVGVLSFELTDGAKQRLMVDGGYAEVKEDTIVILADDALTADNIDADQIHADISRIEAGLAAGGIADNVSNTDTDQLLRSLKRARACLEVVEGG